MTGHYTVLALAGARTPWLALATRWSTEGSLPIEVVPCVSSSEVTARLGLGRRWSAVLVDSALPAADRDLVASAHDHGAAVIAVGSPVAGADAVIGTDLTRHELLDALAHRATPAGQHLRTTMAAQPSWQAPIVTVFGPGGTGSSVVAMALAQGLADGNRHGSVVLADLARRADQAMLHDARFWTHGMQELVEAHRRGVPTADDLRSYVVDVERRGYALLCGLRRARAWPTIRPQAFAAAMRSLRSAWDLVVCDTDADLEGARDGGSVDIEERNGMARTACADARVVIVVGAAGVKGIHSLVRALDDLAELRGGTAGIVAAVNRAPSRGRVAINAALSDLGPPLDAPPVLLPEAHVERVLLDGGRMPRQLVAPLVAAVAPKLVASSDLDHLAETDPEPVRPGSLGVAAVR